MWRDRIGVSLTGYVATTTDALFVVAEQPSTGQTSQVRNVGEIQNKGIEASADFSVIRNPTLTWDMSLTYSLLRNKVTDMAGLEPFDLSTNARREFGRIQEGYPVGVRYMAQAVDTNGDGLLDGSERGIVCWPDQPCTGDPDADRVMTPYPTSTGSIGTNVSLPQFGLSISVQGDWSKGSTVQDYGAIWAYFNDLPRIVYPEQFDLAGVSQGTYNYLDAMNTFLVKGDYFKLRELSVRYQLPQSVANTLGGADASLTFSARNLWTWVPGPQSIFNPENSRRYLLDPELSGYAEPTDVGLQLGGSQSVALPPPHSFRFGFQITF